MEVDANSETDYASPSNQSNEEDIGGFASVSGCLHKLKSSEKQVRKFFNE